MVLSGRSRYRAGRGRGSRLLVSCVALAVCTGLFAFSASAAGKVRVSTVKGFYTTALQELAAKYMALHPEVSVEINLQPDNLSLKRYYTAQMAAGRADAPDIVHGNILGAVENYHEGHFLACNTYLKEPNPYADGVAWESLFDPVFLQVLAVDGIHCCILPLDYVSVGLFYNKDLFQRFGVAPPATWEAWIEVCRTFQEGGITPVSVPGAAHTDLAAWVIGMLDDACLRRFIPEVMAQPGDWNYTEANAGYVQDLSDPYADQMITINPERLMKAFLDGRISYELPVFVEAYTRLQELTQYYGFGHLGTDQAGAYNLFISGKAAMWLIGSWRIGSLIKDMADLPPERRFDWGVFPVPPIEHSEHDLAPLRGIGGAGHQLSVVNKNDEEQHRRVIDFLMFLYAPDQAAYLTSRTLELGEFIQGAPMIKGVELPAELAEKLAGFGKRGYIKVELVPDPNDNDTVLRMRPYGQLFALGELSPEDFLQKKQELTLRLVRRIVQRRGYDLDPATEDQPD